MVPVGIQDQGIQRHVPGQLAECHVPLVTIGDRSRNRLGDVFDGMVRLSTTPCSIITQHGSRKEIITMDQLGAGTGQLSEASTDTTNRSIERRQIDLGMGNLEKPRQFSGDLFRPNVLPSPPHYSAAHA